ncbi:MAG TPA: hypothetical protein ENJ00_07110 [Phycisphaerales bacterium]|nr:hypothetical protein [Phycisphaerales bacterium]
MRWTSAATVLAFILIAGCSGSNKRVRTVRPTLSNAPSVLRGTIGYETRLRRAEPSYVSGYGLVVGLHGTGSTNIPENIAATMEREILIMAGGEAGGFVNTPFEGMTPREVIRHPDTAVVLVDAAVPAGAPEGTHFDVRVSSLSGSTTESLEGGILWTTRLQLGPPSMLGGVQTEHIAEARGEVFLNPFAEPGQKPNPRIGRVLGGGTVSDPQPLELLLETPLHSRSQAITTAINQRFPDGPRGSGSTARGRDDQVIQVFAPPAYKDKFADFVQLLLHTPINQDYPEQLARRYTRAMVDDPSAADELSWALRAIGPQAIGFLRDLYEFPEQRPRMAALRAGAHLGDTRATAFLERIAFEARDSSRIEAIELLGVAPGRGSVERTLQDLLETEDELTIRIAAYEALMERARRARLEQLVASNVSRPGVQQASAEQLLYLAETRIPRGNPQGVERIDVGRRFSLDIVPFGKPLVYVTQQGRPRIAIIGRKTDLKTPLFVSAWSDRLIIVAEDAGSEIRLRYESPEHGPIFTQRISPNLADLIEYMARGASATDYRPGLGFTYSEVVGALSAIQSAGGTEAAFATENDRLLASILQASRQTTTDRPALIDSQGRQIELDEPGDADAEPVPTEGKPTYVVPLKPSGETDREE